MNVRYFSNGSVNIIHDDTNGGGDDYIAKGFTEYPDAASLPVMPEPVPESITKLQLKYALGADWPTVKAAIAANPDLQEDWDLTSEVHRDSPLVNGTAQALGYTPQQIDDIFRAAAKVVV